MVVSQDNTPSFIPDRKPRFVILGTMVAICARTLDGREPSEPTFYYHNNRNHFWRVMQHLLEPGEEIKKMTVEEKKSFLNRHRVMIQNLVQEIIVPNSEAKDPSDTVLFKAYKRNRIKFKKISAQNKKLMEKTPLLFTCRHKKGISQLVDGFFQTNGIAEEAKKNIWYLPTPTRCNPKDRSEIWREEISQFWPNFF